MKRNSKLSLALHALGHMALDPACARTSTEIAEHNATNPVVVRRVLGALREAGLVKSEKGYGGGWFLTRPPKQISLADVYLALGERFLRPEHRGEDNPPECAIERALLGRVDAALDAAEATLVHHLGSATIDELCDSYRAVYPVEPLDR